MNTDKHRLIHEELTHDIIGCSMEVLNTLGHGLLEKPYENALVVEFKERQIAYLQQERYNVTYKNVKVGEYIPDLIVANSVIVDTKVIKCITQHEVGQMINYLKITGLRVGLIINFGHAKLEWQRLII